MTEALCPAGRDITDLSDADLAAYPWRVRRAITRMRPASEFVTRILNYLRTQVRVGDNLLDIDGYVRDEIGKIGASSCYVNYQPHFADRPFGHYICTSVNDAVLHAVPFDYQLQSGDLLSLDLAVEVEGYVADACLSLIPGKAAAKDLELIQRTEQVMWAGIKEIRAGGSVGDVSAGTGEMAANLGYRLNTRYGGHGVGKTMHEAPFIPNVGIPGSGVKLKAGAAITVEPFLMHTTDQMYVGKDGWTVYSSDGSRGAHAERTVIVTPDGCVVMTPLLPGGQV